MSALMGPPRSRQVAPTSADDVFGGAADLAMWMATWLRTKFFWIKVMFQHMKGPPGFEPVTSGLQDTAGGRWATKL